MQLELAHAHVARPVDGAVEQSASDPAPAVLGRDHQPEVGHVPARRMGVPCGREAGDDHADVLANQQ